MSRIVGWVYSANFKQSAVSDFLAGADPIGVNLRPLTPVTKARNRCLNRFKTAKNRFKLTLMGADPLLVAYAAAHRFTVVSHELHVPGQRRKVKIPTVCGALGIACMRTFDMLRHEKAVFNL